MDFTGYVTVKEYPQTPSEKSITLFISDKNLPEFCLTLLLLLKGQIEMIHLTSELEQDISLTKIAGHKKTSGLVSWKTDRTHIMVSKITLGCWTDWLNTYYVTGTSAVNHIDNEFESQDCLEKSLNLILVIERGTPPVSM